MIVAIDGPAGAGKSSVAKLLAERLGFAFLDTGAMYRCVTLFCIRNGIDLTDHHRVAEVARNASIRLDGTSVWLDGEEVTHAIRDQSVSRAIKQVADNSDVRTVMVASQRNWAMSRDVVTEGRDQGTVAFPEAECKIFLTASDEERARRRVAQLQAQGLEADFDEILRDQLQRDRDDRSRQVGALRKANDAIEVVTDGMSESEVLDELYRIVTSTRQSRRSSHLGALGCES